MRLWTVARLLAVAAAAGLPVNAHAEPETGFGQVVHKSGDTYHVEVCPGPAAPGMARCHSHVVTDETGIPLAEEAAGPSAAPAGYGPNSLRNAYSLGAIQPWPPSGGLSNPPVIAIVDAHGYKHAERDLNVYRAQFGLGPCTTANGCFLKVNQHGVQGSYPAQNDNWALEQALDLQMASAVCPQCKIVLVEANSASLADLAAAVNTAAAKFMPQSISNSYGGGEEGSAPFSAAYDHPTIAVTASAGDSGYGVSFPATSPAVIAVGGTRLTQDSTTARGWSETAWSGTGSGCSSVYSKPAWQTDAGCANRTDNDVSAVADPGTGVAVYGPIASGVTGWLVVGGTSVGSPFIAGIYAAQDKPPSCASNPSAYGCELYANPGALNDVTSGSNGTCSPSYLCTAGPGYDGPTGLGTPNGYGAF